MYRDVSERLSEMASNPSTGPYSSFPIFKLHTIVGDTSTILWRSKDKLSLQGKKRKSSFNKFLKSIVLTECLYKDSQRVLGNTFGMCILQDFEALTPVLLQRTIDTVVGGGLIILLLPSSSPLEDLEAMAMEYIDYKVFRSTDHVYNFIHKQHRQTIQLVRDPCLEYYSLEPMVAGRIFKKIELNEPIIYASGDPINSWLNRFLCLDVANDIVDSTRGFLNNLEKSELYYVNCGTLFCYQGQSELFLQRMIALFAASQFENSPIDLQLMADAPEHHFFVLLGPVDESKKHQPDILCVIQVSLEGKISRESAERSLKACHFPHGDEISWKFCELFQNTYFPSLSGARILRIATHPNIMQNDMTGERTCMVLKRIQAVNIQWGCVYQDFKQRFSRLLSSSFCSMDYNLAMSVLDPTINFAKSEAAKSNIDKVLEEHITFLDLKRLQFYVNNSADFPQFDFDEQLKTVWLVEVNGDLGGAFCMDSAGLLITCLHVLSCNNLEPDEILVRGSSDYEFRRDDLVQSFQTLDIALIRLCKKPDEVFPALSLADQIRVDRSDRVVGHVHCQSLPFSSMFGNVSYPYLSGSSFEDVFGDIDLSLRECRDLQDDRIQLDTDYRTILGCVDSRDSELNTYHPYLPLVQVEKFGLEGGALGCPLFNESNCELIGMFLLRNSCYHFVVPVDIIRCLVERLDS